MSIIYRPHRGGLEESLANAVTFSSEEMMKKFITDEHNMCMDYIQADIETHITTDDIVIDSNEVDDARIGWRDTRYVCLKKGYGKDYMKECGCPQAIGFCATFFPGSTKIEETKDQITSDIVNAKTTDVGLPKSFKSSTINIILNTWWKAFPYVMKKYSDGDRYIVAVADNKEDLNPSYYADTPGRNPEVTKNPDYDLFERKRFMQALKGNDVMVDD